MHINNSRLYAPRHNNDDTHACKMLAWKAISFLICDFHEFIVNSVWVFQSLWPLCGFINKLVSIESKKKLGRKFLILAWFLMIISVMISVWIEDNFDWNSSWLLILAQFFSSDMSYFEDADIHYYYHNQSLPTSLFFISWLVISQTEL